MMKFYSHAIEVDGEKKGSKMLKEHLSGVYKKAINGFNGNVLLTYKIEELKQVIKDISYYHDLGKYTEFFQRYLPGYKTDGNLKNHSRIGAFVLLNKYADNPLLATFLYFMVLNHHSNLDDILNIDLMEGNFNVGIQNNFDQQCKSITSVIGEISNDLDENAIASYLRIPETTCFRKTIKKRIKKAPSISDYFTINYLFSLLVESDKLDASGTRQYQRKKVSEQVVDHYIGRTELSNLPPLSEIVGKEQNTLRNYVRASVLSNLKREDILDNMLFTLTAPTGIGKTLTSLDFAIHLKKLIREKENQEAQIIYGLPFINIIEQGLDVYSQVFKNELQNNEINILAHYQLADIFGKESKQKNNDENRNYNQRMMSMQTWQSDIVITSFVQFFETLISNKNKMLLKFNHLAGSIIILDEIQTIRLEQLPLLGAILFYVSKLLHARVILMTATKPKIFELANEQILKNEGEVAKPFELLEKNEGVFKKFNRTKLVPLPGQPIITGNDFYNLFKDKRTADKSCLIVCNTVQRSIDIFNKLQEKQISPLYYLSTNIVSANRLSIIRQIKNDLASQKAPVLVSTQVVEAGVDLDFDMGFRDLAPLDSIVQVAGRINRENDISKTGSPLYIIEFEKENGKKESVSVYDTLTRAQVLKAFGQKSEIAEENYLKIINEYYSGITKPASFHVSRNFFKSIKNLCYNSENSDEYPVSNFKIIKDAPWAISVFIELSLEAQQVRLAYNKLLEKKISKESFNRNFKMIFHQHIIAVPDYLQKVQEIKQMDWMLSENLWYVPFEEVNNYYDNKTGFIRKAEKEPVVCML